MTKKAEFNAEEWETVVEGPVFVGSPRYAEELGVGEAAARAHCGPRIGR